MNANPQPPLVSVVTPSFNQARFIAETIASVHCQDYRPIEHFVIDAASTDGTLEILQRWAREHNDASYQLKWTSEQDRGLGDGVNRGFERVTGEIVGWLNSDDVYFDKLAISSAVRELQSDESVDIVYGDVALISEDSGLWMIWCFPEFHYKRLLRGYLIPQPTVFFRKRVTDVVRIDPELPVAHDVYVWLVAGQNYKFKHIHRIQAGDRDHAGRQTYAVEDKWAQRRKEMYRSFGGSEDPTGLVRYADRATRLAMRVKGGLYLLSLFFSDPNWRKHLAFPMWIDSRSQVLKRQSSMRITDRLALVRPNSSPDALAGPLS